MPTPRSVLFTTVAAAVLVASASPCLAQGRILDEGVLVITRPGAAQQTESFRIQTDNGLIKATGQLNAGTQRISSALTTDSSGTPVEYHLEVRENGAPAMTLTALARAGRLTARAQQARGDESMREYPVAAGNCLILEDELLHQTYFVSLVKRSGRVQVIKPRAAHGGTLTVVALGLEPVTIAGRQVTATHYSLTNGTGRREFWVDAAGRLLQVEIPATGLKAVREELPR